MKEWNFSPRVVAKKERQILKESQRGQEIIPWPEYHG
jgi:hypothetical protein